MKYAKPPVVSKLRDLQKKATVVTLAICGPKNKTKVCSPVPSPTEEDIPNTTQ